MKSNYREQEKRKAVNLIKNEQVFNGDKGGKLYYLKEKNKLLPKADLLMNGKNNLFYQITDDVILYFDLNKITFHHLDGDSDKELCMPSGHTLSSQIACINHLFSLRNDKEAVENIFGLQNAEKIEDNSYIAFEYVNNNKTYLKENVETRGTKCTSIDAFVKINNVGIGIEWKYTETDFNTTNTQSYWKQRYNERYKPLLKNSNIIEKDALISCQMYYEIMRQTLLLEQMTVHNEIIDYKNIVVCPKNNKELYDCCQKWKVFLKDDKKFGVIDPKDLMANIDKFKYKELISYLETRYW